MGAPRGQEYDKESDKDPHFTRDLRTETLYGYDELDDITPDPDLETCIAWSGLRFP